MAQPVRCFSSAWTTGLLTWRNFQGEEKNWVGKSVTCGSYFRHAGKVITAEVGVTLLCVTSAVETAVYGVCFLGSVPFIKWTMTPFHYFWERLESSSFTFFWNIGNLTIFNLFYLNVVTNESLARYAMDSQSSGRYFQILIGASAIASLAATLLTLSTPMAVSTHIFTKGLLGIAPYALKQHTREKDADIVADFATSAARNQPNSNEDRLVLHGSTINEGAAFIEKYFLAEGQIDEVTRARLLKRDDLVFDFILARSIWIYVDELKTVEKLPQFLCQSLAAAIETLRNGKQNFSDLGTYLTNFEKFQQGCQESFDKNSPIDLGMNLLMSKVSLSSTNTLFLKQSLRKACESWNPSAVEQEKKQKQNLEMAQFETNTPPGLKQAGAQGILSIPSENFLENLSFETLFWSKNRGKIETIEQINQLFEVTEKHTIIRDATCKKFAFRCTAKCCYGDFPKALLLVEAVSKDSKYGPTTVSWISYIFMEDSNSVIRGKGDKYYSIPCEIPEIDLGPFIEHQGQFEKLDLCGFIQGKTLKVRYFVDRASAILYEVNLKV